MKLCKVCGVKEAPYGQSRCCDCQRKKNTLEMRKRREQKRALLMECDNDRELLEKKGWRICAACRRLRHLSEFSTNRDNGEGKPHKVCDRCLTLMYTKRADKEFGKNYWRKKAYGMNSVARRLLAKKRNVPVSSLTLADLPWVCKPQDLAALYEQQHGNCHYCGVHMTAKTVSCDHKMPLSRGGAHSLDNLTLSCLDCNLLKMARTSEEFMVFAREYAQRFLSDVKDKEP